MTSITIRQGTAAGTQGAGHEYLQKVKGFIGAVAYELSPYFGPMRPMSLDHAGLSVKDRVLLVVVQFDFGSPGRRLRRSARGIRPCPGHRQA